MSGLPEGFVVRNTFLQSAGVPIGGGEVSNMRRVKTAALDGLGATGSLTLPSSTALPAPTRKSGTLLPPVESSEESVAGEYVIVWVSAESFKNSFHKEELEELGRRVRCYKTAEKFMRAFKKGKTFSDSVLLISTTEFELLTDKHIPIPIVKYNENEDSWSTVLKKIKSQIS